MSGRRAPDVVNPHARAAEKRQQVLRFLRDEKYTITDLVTQLLGVAPSNALSTLYSMERKGLIVRDELEFMGHRIATIWGITSEGILEAFEPEEIATANTRPYSPGRISPRTIEHTLDVQRWRLRLEKAGCNAWKPTRLLPGQEKPRNHKDRWSVYPDGIAWIPQKTSSGEVGEIVVAFEIERTAKSSQRYVQIIRGHLKNIQAGRYGGVFYVCPEQKKADTLKALFSRLIEEKQIRYDPGGEEPLWDASRTITLFRFTPMEGGRIV